MTRPSRRRNAADNDVEEINRLPSAMRQRNRAVAEREASRLARPERRKVSKLAHASKDKSAVTSTPFGFHTKSLPEEATGSDNEWCGPFSVARQMISKRDEARRKREAEQAHNGSHHPLDAMMEQVEMEKKRKAHPSLQWRGKLPENSGTSDNLYSKRRKRMEVQTAGTVKIKSLFQLCVDFLVENFEYVEALGDVGSSIRSAICRELVAKSKMNGAAFDAIAEPGIEALELVDCAEVTQDQLAESLESLVPAGLRFLLLNHSGRCFGPKAVNAITSCKTEDSALFAISVGGAYLLKDNDAANLISHMAPTLTSIEFKACPLLGTAFCESLSKNFSSSSNHLLELSLEDLQLKKEGLLSLGSPKNTALSQLKSLSVRQCVAVDDEVVETLLAHVGDSVESLDFSYNYNLSDETLNTIRRCNESNALRSLQLCGLKNLSSAGLETLFTHGIEGLPNPPVLRSLNLSGCAHEAVTDEVLDLVIQASSMKAPEEGTTRRAMSNFGGIVHLRISGASCTDKTMECLAATSAFSLKELDTSFCPKVTDNGLGYLVSKAGSQLEKIHVWGCAQITDEFLDGHARVGDSHFEINGAWMKKAGARSLR